MHCGECPNRGYTGAEKSSGLLNKYHELPPQARWKALILEHGVTFDDPESFSDCPQIGRFKTKKRILKPTRDGLAVIDTSKDPSLIPSEIIIGYKSHESIVKLGYRDQSPIGILIDKTGHITLVDQASDALIPIRARLVEKNPYTEERVPSSVDPGHHLLEDYIGLVGLDRLSVMPFDGCWNWNSGLPCGFCDYNPKGADYDTARPLTNTLKQFNLDIQRWWEQSKNIYLKGLAYTFQYIKDHAIIAPHRHLLLMSGNLPDPRFVWHIASEVADTLNSIDPIRKYDNYLNICPHPDIQYLLEMRKKGVQQVQYNLEVIGEETFERFCPGKLPYRQFQQKLIEAVDIMGRGNVRSNFVLGLQRADELLNGIAELAGQGIVADYSIFQPKKSTPLEKYASPSMDTIVWFTKELAKIYKTYGYTPIYCSLSSRSSIINEVL